MQRSILVIRFGSLGDVVLTSATVLNLKIAHPHHRIVYLTRERYRSVVERFPAVDRVETIANRMTWAGLFRRLLELDRLDPDIIVDLHGNFRSWLTRAVVTANSRHVYPKRRLSRWLLTRRHKTLPSEYPHTIDLYNQTLVQMGEPFPCRRPAMSVPPLASSFASLVETDRKIILVCPGAAHPTKAWPVENFAAVVRALHQKRTTRVLWAVTASERKSCALPADMSGPDTVELVDCPLDQLAALAGRASVALTNDSGVGHLASAVGTPVVALFGPTHPALGFAPRGLRDRVMQVDEPCRPCSRHGKRPCWREERFCFTRLSAESVTRAVEEVMDNTDYLSPALFVDRDGTLIVNQHYLSDPEQVELIDGAAEALKLGRGLGYKIVVVSNQSGVARGYHTYEDVERVNARVAEVLSRQGAGIDAFYFCPHHEGKGVVPEFAISCDCRKPAPGMAEQAALELALDLRRSVVIGDSVADYDLGRVIGARSILVRTGYGVSEIQRLGLGGGPNFETAEDLLHAVRILAEARSHMTPG